MVRLCDCYSLQFTKLTYIGTRGFVATFQAFQKGLGPFLVTRLLLG